MEETAKARGISSLTLHLLAMALMLCDHLWATVVPGNDWLTSLGRIAFPIFAFMAAEGYCHTRNFKRYLRRLLVFALLSEIPFNLMYGGSIFYPFHQNVIWTLLLGLLSIRAVDLTRRKGKLWRTCLVSVAAGLGGLLLGTVLLLDYYGFGVVTVLLFYLFRGKTWWQRLGQLAGLYAINVIFLGGRVIPLTFFGRVWEFPQQGFALLALLPLWLYQGRQGPHNKGIQLACYAFYPVHMLLLAAFVLL